MSDPQGITMTTIGTRTNGCPRVWIEGARLDRAGFQPSARYCLEVDEGTQSILLKLDPQGERVVSRRAKGEAFSPVVEIASVKALSMFDGLDQLAIRFESGFIRISPAASDRRKLERSIRLRSRLSKGDPLRVGSVSTGLGVLALAMHEGLQNAGLDSTLAFSVEIDQGYQDHSQATNPVWAPDTVAISAPMQEVAFDHRLLGSLPQVDILEAGIPCTAHSVAGRAKKGLAMPEHDPVAGHLIAGFLAIVAACNPAVVIVENVVQYMQSASYSILENQLTEWGYDVRSTILSGEDYGCLEHRRRMALVATTPGVDVHLDTLAPLDPPALTLGDILEDIPLDDARWSTMAGLKAKQERDIANGKGFRMQTFGAEATSIATVTRLYAKVRSTDPKICHPTDATLLRQLTPAEHARVKGISEELIDGLSVTRAHEMLGQSVLAAPFRALGERLGGALRAWHEGREAPRGVARLPAIRPVDDLPLFAAA
jgi:DNA (cytosine-5)-methyltransferase 1